MQSAFSRGALLGGLLGLACGAPPPEPAPRAPPPASAASAPEPVVPAVACPANGVAVDPLPRTGPEHEQLDYWLTRTAAVADLDRPLFSARELAAHNARIARRDVFGASARADLLAPVDPARLADDLNTRLGYLRGKFVAAAYVNPDGAAMAPAQVAALTPVLDAGAFAELPSEVRVALDLIPIRCAPQREPYYTPSRDLAFDRNLCSMARAQEPVQILRAWDGGLALARTPYVMGWIDLATAALSPPIAAEHVRRFTGGPFVRAARDFDVLEDMSNRAGPKIHVPFASLLPTAGRRGEVLLAGPGGVVTRPVDAAAVSAPERPLTRRAVLTEAFSFLHRPYGWGDYAGGRDCSRFLMDMFGGLGLVLPRHTSDQALAGVAEDLAPDLPEPERLRRIDAAHRRGVVLLHFPGHIMLYLGRDDAGVPMAIHSFAEYLVPCPGRPDGAPAGERETLLKVDGVHVSDLELGRGTSRGAFVERISKITVLAPPALEPRP
ncbi:NlpC/P60 family protein [Nannocystis bainbridge]|uniref:NlpC/P60 family protein n=1 Tax=Nannocystis bainbridge TaxID=2995303 RepID=A0ABT5DUX0_9BACT|nr:NlpC/P60 family protein [Nannocystis bainbridge]MDC0717394.1 NlpC/P60 family protein [Nannocystis bainbridge]